MLVDLLETLAASDPASAFGALAEDQLARAQAALRTLCEACPAPKAPTLLDLPDEVIGTILRHIVVPSREEYVDQLLETLDDPSMQSTSLVSDKVGLEAGLEQHRLVRTLFRPPGQRELQAVRAACRQTHRLINDDDELSVKARYCIRRVEVQPSSWSARGDVRGGGTGREFLRNLGVDGKLPWNKWFDAGAGGSSWVHAMLGRPTRLVGYALMSGNDCPHRDPTDWEVTSMRPEQRPAAEVTSMRPIQRPAAELARALRGKLSVPGEPIVLHAVEGHDFKNRYEWAVGRLPGTEVSNVGIRINKSRGGRDIQLSQVLLLEEVGIV